MKKKSKVLLVVIVIVAVLVCGAVYAKIQIDKQIAEAANWTIEAVDLSTLADGEYVGSLSLFPMTVKIKTVVKDHKIVDIQNLELFTGKPDEVKQLEKNILDQQKVDVDAVSGATGISRVIQKAMSDSLKTSK